MLFNCCDAQRKLRSQRSLRHRAKGVGVRYITDPENIRVLERDRDSPANSLVQELAILVNQLSQENSLNELVYPYLSYSGALRDYVVPAEGEKLTMDHVDIEGARLAVNPEIPVLAVSALDIRSPPQFDALWISSVSGTSARPYSINKHSSASNS